MSGAIPARPSVLDATVLSNFAYLDRVECLTVLSRAVTVPAVRDELARGARSYPFLRAATAALSDSIPVVSLEGVPDDRLEALDERLDPARRRRSRSRRNATDSS